MLQGVVKDGEAPQYYRFPARPLFVCRKFWLLSGRRPSQLYAVTKKKHKSPASGDPRERGLSFWVLTILETFGQITSDFYHIPRITAST